MTMDHSINVSELIRSTKSKIEIDSLVGSLISEIGTIPGLPDNLQRDVAVGKAFAEYQIEEKKRRLRFLTDLQMKYYPEDYERENGL